MKKIVRLTESDLHKIVKESVKRVLRESAKDDEIADSWLWYDTMYHTPELKPNESPDDAYFMLANKDDWNTLLWDLQNNARNHDPYVSRRDWRKADMERKGEKPVKW
jgi:hypothetical protein